MARRARQLIGVEAVLADGSIIRRLDGLEKDNTGYDLAGLICGSEGTLAVVTAARLRLVPRPAHAVVALLAFDVVDAALDAVGTLRRELDCVQALELFLQPGLDLVCEQLGLVSTVSCTPRRVRARRGSRARRSHRSARRTPSVRSRLPMSPSQPMQRQPRSLWRFREAHTEAINLFGAPHKLDVSLPSGSLGVFMHEVPACVRAVAPEAQVWLFGHAGDGNVHVNVTGVAPDDERITDAVLTLVGAVARIDQRGTRNRHGEARVTCISCAATAEISTFRAIKRALDPLDILNPNVLLPETKATGDGDGGATYVGHDVRSDRSGHPA